MKFSNTSTTNNSAPMLSIGLVSATALAYEILLLRLFSIIQWHHFAYMVISLALLGYGLSGSFVAIAQRWLQTRFSICYLTNLYLFGLSIAGCFLLAQQIPFNPEQMLWDYRQVVWLFMVYVILSLPFFFAANAIALAMICHRQIISRIYAFDLVGAGLGSLAIIGMLFFVLPIDALTILGVIALLTMVLASWELRINTFSLLTWLYSRTTYLVISLCVVTLLFWTLTNKNLKISPYKSLSQTLQITGSRIIAEHSSPLGLIHVLENKTIPFRHAPGLSLNAKQEPPPQLGLFTDGDGMSVITQFPKSPDSLATLGYLDHLTSAVPYHLRKPQQVLILGAGGGSKLLQARYHNTLQIDAVELNPQIVRLLREDYADYAGNLYNLNNVKVHINDVRGYLTGSSKQYDLIQLASPDSFGASSAGLYSLNENYLYTVEAIQLYLQNLKQDGYLAISRWVSLPPRATLKLFATAIDALKANGIQNPGQHLLLIRSWQTSTLILKNGIFNKQEITALKKFCLQNSFDLAYYPGIQQQEVNRFNKLQQPYFYIASQALLGQQDQDFIEHYKFNLQPATDDRPYYFNFFKWSTLREIINLRGQGGVPLLESGYLVLITILIQALFASLILILLPLWIIRRQNKTVNNQICFSRVLIYFSVLGLAFLFIEIAFIQKFILFLQHPLYATSVVLSSFLIFAGLGSAWSRWQHKKISLSQNTGYAIAGIVCLLIFYLLVLGVLFNALMAFPVWLKIPITIVLIAPLAFCMGIPFPSALSRLGEIAPDLIPWAWGINGCASVLSAVLATLIAIHMGFSTVIICALFLYFIAYLSFPRQADKFYECAALR